VRVPNTKAASHASWLTSAPSRPASTVSPVKLAPIFIPYLYLTCAPTDTPTPKFGEALRQQVEERLAFFETGAPPGKNADAIRKVLDQLALEEDVKDEDMADTKPVLPLIEAEVLKKKDKKKKRKVEEMDLDEHGDGGGDGEPVKKVKLSKEEKKALKREMKRERKMKAEEAEEVSNVDFLCTLYWQ
jgi:nucleolar protein 56